MWTSAGGVVWLPRLDISLPSDKVFPNAIARGGSLVFGAVGDAFFSLPIAFVWSAENGTRSVSDIAAAAGVDVPEGLILNNVMAASEDGTVLIGNAMDADFNSKTYVLRLPASAY